VSKKLTIQHAYDLAAQHDGYCLDTEWRGAREKYMWKCKEGHVWTSLYTDVQQGAWCYHCGIKSRIQKVCLKRENYERLASKHGGKCLVVEKNANNSSTTWQCKNEHVWNSSYSHIRRGQWCPYCAKNYLLSDNDYHIMAAKHNGECLYVGLNALDSTSLWKCEFGHIWKARYANIQQGKWCPICPLGRGRKKIQDIVESIFIGLCVKIISLK
jgi:hypothetical protein